MAVQDKLPETQRPDGCDTLPHSWDPVADAIITDQEQHWKTKGAASPVPNDTLWTDNIAQALGYGKRGRTGAAFQAWIPAVSAVVTLVSYIAWCVLTQRAAQNTDKALAAYGLEVSSWATAKRMLVATAVLYPLLVLLGLGVAVWRGLLARRLHIHKLDAGWLINCRRYQVANATTSTMIWVLLLGLVVSIAGHGAWLYTAYAGSAASNFALVYIDPIWSSISRVVDTTQSVTNTFVGSLETGLAQLPILGRRRALLAAELGLPPAALAAFLAADGAPGVDPTRVTATAAAAAGAASRALHADTAPAPATDGLAAIGSIANAVGNVLSSLPSALPPLPIPNITLPEPFNRLNLSQALPLNLSALPGLEGLRQPNGSASPLLSGLSDLTNLVQQQLLNRTGCPIYCVDLSSFPQLPLTGSRCLCNLDRVRAGAPLLRAVMADVLPAFALAIVMYVGASWLLLHAAAQWARTRTEAKLMQRKPGPERIASLMQSGPVGSSTLGAAVRGPQVV